MKNVLLSPPLSNPHSEHQPIYLPRNSSTISRKVSGPAVGSVGSAPTQIWPHSSLYLLPKPTIAPRVHSLANYGYLVSCTGGCRGEFLSSRLRSPWRLPLFVGLPPAPVPHPDQSRQQQRLIKVHLLSRPGERKGYGGHNWGVWGCLLQPRPAGSCYSLRQAVCSPRRIGRGSGVPWQSHAAQAPGSCAS